MQNGRIYEDIMELLKCNNLSKQERLLCIAILQIHKEIAFIKRLMWLTLSVVISNAGLVAGLVYILK